MAMLTLEFVANDKKVVEVAGRFRDYGSIESFADAVRADLNLSERGNEFDFLRAMRQPSTYKAYLKASPLSGPKPISIIPSNVAAYGVGFVGAILGAVLMYGVASLGYDLTCRWPQANGVKNVARGLVGEESFKHFSNGSFAKAIYNTSFEVINGRSEDRRGMTPRSLLPLASASAVGLLSYGFAKSHFSRKRLKNARKIAEAKRRLALGLGRDDDEDFID